MAFNGFQVGLNKCRNDAWQCLMREQWFFVQMKSSLRTAFTSSRMNPPTQSDMASYLHTNGSWRMFEVESMCERASTFICTSVSADQSFTTLPRSVYTYESYLPWLRSLIGFTSCDDAEVDMSYMVTISNYPTPPRIWKCAISTRWLAHPSWGHRHFSHNFWSSYEYLIHYRSDMALLSWWVVFNCLDFRFEFEALTF